MSSPLKEFAHLRIPLADIKLATDNFAGNNIIGRGGFGRVYKGQLLYCEQLIDIAVKRLDRNAGHGDKEFWTDIRMRSSLKHENLLAVVGFCDEDNEKIIINKYQVNGSLDKYLSNPISLTWLQRLHICIGVARALSYIHSDTGRNYDVIHRNIKSSKILLDGNWDAKVSGFGLSINNLATRRHRLVLDNIVGTMGYADPVYVETETVTHKSDVYSFGVVLFEVLSGRQAFVKDAEGKYQSLAPIARRRYEEGKLDEIIDPYLRNQMHPQSFKIFSDTAYHCLKNERAYRPDMEKVAKRLEKAWELQHQHENPEHLKPPVVGTSPIHLKVKNLDHMKIQLADILLATDNFSEAYYIGSGGYGMVYKGELDHFDSDNPTEIDGKSESEFPKRRSTVAIKRIVRADGQGEQSFYSEISLLTRCKHPNIVSLLGFCDDDSQQILIYEYASHGSLNDYLGNTNNMITFTWVQRIQLCLDIANGLNYLHSTTKEKQMIVHRDIKSDNILLGNNWEAKITDFGLSRIRHTNNQASTLDTCNVAGTEVYIDPEYLKTGKLTKESDIYSFGVVLFEILSGRPAYDECYYVGNDRGLPSTVRRFLNEGILKEIVDSRVKEETSLNSFTLNRGPNQDSLDAFLKISYQCLEETRAKRPTMEIIIKELEKALYFQENNKDKLKVSLEDIKLATQNFSDHNLIGRGGFGKVYKGEVLHANGITIIAAKRLDRQFGQGDSEFLKELEILLEYKNDNVIGLVGYCDEMSERIIVYEYATHKSLDLYLSSTDLTWMKRLKICIDIASGLEFLHGGAVTQDVVIHRDLKSGNILLTEEWKAKITDFGLSLISPINQEMDYVIDNVVGTFGYCDPLYMDSFLTKESDMYSFGVVLLEIVSGRLIYSNGRVGTPILKHHYEQGTFEEMVFEGIKEQIVPNSLTIFLRIANQCLRKNREDRPTAGEVVVQLKKALEVQVDHEDWEPKLPNDYEEIIRMSESPEIYFAKKKEDLYNMFIKGIILQHGKSLLTFNGNGERNEMISATEFSYMSGCLCKWQSLPESRFHKVREMLDISNLMIRIDTKPQFLDPNTLYGAHLIFKFRDSRKCSSKPMYVNLKYRDGIETLHTYFATWRDKDWMMIQLCQFLNRKEDIAVALLLESLSPYYCTGDDAIYIEGIEFRAINNTESKEVQQVLKSNIKNVKSEEIFEMSDDGQKFLQLSEVKEKKHLMLSAKAGLHNVYDLKLFKSIPSAEYKVFYGVKFQNIWKYTHNEAPPLESRFQEVIELLSQVFHINYTLRSQMLSQDTEYGCYLVFKLSKNCQGMHGPVEVRDLLYGENKETEIVYLKTPSPLNLHDFTRVPKQRGDGWMEVNVWRFNSYHELDSDCIPLTLKLTSYAGNMSGLIVCGFEFRPI